MSSLERVIARHRAELSQPRVGELDSVITSNARHYIRDHFVDRPPIERDQWALDVSGRVQQPCTISWDDLAQLPRHQVVMTMECAGNGGHSRGAGRPQTMMFNMVGTATWAGARLGEVLDLVGISPDANFAVVAGADGGRDPDEPSDIDRYLRSIPLDQALGDSTLLAYEMNGEAPLGGAWFSGPADRAGLVRHGLGQVAYDICARATDLSGRTQPLTDQPVRTYEANWVHRVRTYVVDGLNPST